MTEPRTINYACDGVTLTGEVLVPDSAGPHPAVLLYHDGLGISDVVRRRARDLAAAGYVAFAADMFGSGRREQSAALHGPIFADLQKHPDRLVARIVAAFDTVRSLREVDADRIGAIGFCFGGQCVLELARSGADAKAVVSFHGILRTTRPARPGAVGAAMLVLTGAHDPYAPVTDVEGFQTEMTTAGATWQLTVYGDGWHSFTDPDVHTLTDAPGLRYDPLLDRLSWAQATAFLNAALAPSPSL